MTTSETQTTPVPPQTAQPAVSLHGLTKVFGKETVVDALDLDVPGDDDLEEVWPAGDLGIFSDLGLDEMELGAILADDDAYADEMLSALTRRLGFVDAYERVVDALVQ